VFTKKVNDQKIAISSQPLSLSQQSGAVLAHPLWERGVRGHKRGPVYSYTNVCINSGDDSGTSFKNLVNSWSDYETRMYTSVVPAS